jgi:hypothetical protein
VQELLICAICGVAIEAGQAWMAADVGQTQKRAHVGCLYREGRRLDEEPRDAWVPQEHAAR